MGGPARAWTRLQGSGPRKGVVARLSVSAGCCGNKLSVLAVLTPDLNAYCKMGVWRVFDKHIQAFLRSFHSSWLDITQIYVECRLK